MTARLSSASLLKLVRDSGTVTLHDAAAHFDAEVWPSLVTGRYRDPQPVCVPLAGLVAAGVLRISRIDSNAELDVADLRADHLAADSIQITMRDVASWNRLQLALQLSLTELDAMQTGNAMIVSPVFGPPRTDGIRRPYPEVLVLMPFSEEFEPVYDTIAKAVDRCGVTVARANELDALGVVMQQVWAAICKAQLIIADCSILNPNVFYELGIAHAVGTPTLLITRDPQSSPFDIRHLRHIPYRPEQLSELSKTVHKLVREELPNVRSRASV